MSISGYLDLGTAIVSGAIVTPPAGTNYAAQPVTFDEVAGGITLSGVSCTFGPVSGSWGTLTCFMVSDQNGNPYWPGTLAAPFTPVNGQLINVPQGNISLVVGGQLSAAPADVVVSAPQKGPTTSGSVALTSGAYSAVMASGARNALLLTNTSASGIVQVLLGGVSAPASGAAGWSIIPPLGSWPPPALAGFVPTDSIWALSAGVTGLTLNYLHG